MTKFVLNVEGLHCKSCVTLVEDALQDKGAKSIHIVLDEKKQKAVVSCDYEGDKMDVVNAIKNEGYKVLK
jgi:copper chaperone CopZ